MENLIYVILLALHNIALVGCVAAPFYNLRLTNQRGKHGQKVFYELDNVVENTIQGNEPYCWAFIITLYITGFGFPAVYYVFHGRLADFRTVAFSAFVVKHALVLALVVFAFVITFFINPKLRALFATFTPGTDPPAEDARRFFALRARRIMLCKICLVVGVLVLLVSPLLRFY